MIMFARDTSEPVRLAMFLPLSICTGGPTPMQRLESVSHPSGTSRRKIHEDEDRLKQGIARIAAVPFPQSTLPSCVVFTRKPEKTDHTMLLIFAYNNSECCENALLSHILTRTPID